MKQIGRYELVRVLGTGGFATVHLGHDPSLDTNVAVKVLSEHLAFDGDIRARFIDEARFLRRLAAPGLVAVHDIGEEDGLPYFVMEFCERGTLSERFAGMGRPLSIDEGLHFARAMTTGVAVLHRAGVVHRDLKPSNFMIRRVEHSTRTAIGQAIGLDEELVVGDFGMAKEIDLDASRLTFAAGTLGFGAPEQFRGDASVDARADVYAASATLVVALSGVDPKPVTTGADEVFPLEALQATGPLAPELQRGLSIDRSDRQADISQWFDALVAAWERPRTASTVLVRSTGSFSPSADELADVDDTGNLELGLDQLGHARVLSAVGGFQPDQPSTEDSGRRVRSIVLLAVAAAVLMAAAVGAWAMVGGGGEDRAGDELEAGGELGAGGDLGVGGDLDPAGPGGSTDGAEPRLAPSASVAGDGRSGESSSVPTTSGSTTTTSGSTSETSESPSVQVPSLGGQSQSGAEQRLRQLGLAVRVRVEANDLVESGLVVRTEPAAGATVDRGTTVTLVVSAGPEQAEIPSVAGQTESAASQLLTAAGFRNIRFRSEGSGRVAVGRVIDTEPGAGQSHPLGSSIVVSISSGPAQVEVPSVVGLSSRAARERLESDELQLVVEVVEQPLDRDDIRIGLVIGTNPGPGAVIRQGDRVIVDLGVEQSLPSTTAAPPTSTDSTALDG